MKSKLIILFFPILLISFTPVQAQEWSASRWQHYMHEIFHSYRNAHMAIVEGRYDIAAIHLRHLSEYVDAASTNIPETKRDGGELDHATFAANLARLDATVDALRSALKTEDAREIVMLSNSVMGVCADCHQKARLGFLFRIPARRSIFADYMHQISDNYFMAEMMMGDGTELEAADNITISGHLLSILKDVIPDKGPSGVILDKEGFRKRITEVERLNEIAQGNIRAHKKVDFEELKKELNTVCVACHEPERVK